MDVFCYVNHCPVRRETPHTGLLHTRAHRHTQQIHHTHMNTPHTSTQAHVHTCKAHTSTHQAASLKALLLCPASLPPAGSSSLPGEASGIKTS